MRLPSQRPTQIETRVLFHLQTRAQEMRPGSLAKKLHQYSVLARPLVEREEQDKRASAKHYGQSIIGAAALVKMRMR